MTFNLISLSVKKGLFQNKNKKSNYMQKFLNVKHFSQKIRKNAWVLVSIIEYVQP